MEIPKQETSTVEAIDLDEIVEPTSEELKLQENIPVLIAKSCAECQPKRQRMARMLQSYPERAPGGLLAAIDYIETELACTHLEEDAEKANQSLLGKYPVLQS